MFILVSDCRFRSAARPVLFRGIALARSNVDRSNTHFRAFCFGNLLLALRWPIENRVRSHRVHHPPDGEAHLLPTLILAFELFASLFGEPVKLRFAIVLRMGVRTTYFY